MNVCYLALGSNLNSPCRQLRLAIRQLQNLPNTIVKKIASFYVSKAWGRRTQPDFYNTVIEIRTTLPPERLLFYCQGIERQLGRVRHVKWGARTIDIDILLYEHRIIKFPALIIPHPELLNRDFVLRPLLEIAPLAKFPDGQLIELACHGKQMCQTIYKS